MSEPVAKVVRYGRSVVSLLRRQEAVGLRPIHMQLEPTSRCNLDCPMCLRKEIFGVGSHMSYALFERVFGQIKPLHITLNGQGEPLLNRDIFRMIKLAEGQGARVNLTSNGNYLKRHFAQLIDSGLTLLSVSLDTVDRETYQVVRSLDLLEQTLEGLALLQAEKKRRGIDKPAVRLSSVMMEATLKHAHAFVDKAHELGITSVLFQPMALFGKWENLELMGPYADRNFYRTTLEELDQYAKARGVDTNLDQVLKDFRIVVQAYDQGVATDNALSKGCLFPWFSLYVRVDGKVHACCVRSYATSGFMGNLKTQTIDEIWNNEDYRKLRGVFREGESLPFSECVGCAPPTLTEMAGKPKYTPGFMKLLGR